MAVKDDTDICLNITGGGEAPKKKSSQISSKAHMSQRDRNASGKKKLLFQQRQSNALSKTPALGANKRIKQKSLAAIVANNLKKANLSNQAPKASILKKANVNSFKKETVSPAKMAKKNTESVAKEKQVSFSPKKDDNQPLVAKTKNIQMTQQEGKQKLPFHLQQINKLSKTPALDTKEQKQKSLTLISENNLKKNDTSNEPLISFTKPTKETAIKTILAKKRKIDSGEPKKSLSSIFKTGESGDANLLKPNLSTNEKNIENVSKKQTVDLVDKESDPDKTVSFEKSGKPTQKLKKSRDKFEKNKNFQQKKDGKEINPRPHQGGKISSLFGHNPTIPNIGQRFVKPVHEKVFSAEKFSDLGIHAYSVSNLEQNMKITTMTTVQKKAIPVILSGSDVLIRSQTGSGKTLSYALPIIEKLQSIRPKLSRNSGIKALVIVPTRELALQTYECFLKLIKPFTWIVPGYLVGGEKRKAEKARLRKGCCVLVATPGRLLDHIKHTQALKLDDIQYFVLDEADRMLDIGYEKDISGIVAALESAVVNAGYDALEMLRQHMKPGSDDKNKNKESSEEEKQKEEKVEIDDENQSDEEKKTAARKQYNSDTEESSDEADVKTSKSVEASSAEGQAKNSGDKSRRRQTLLLSATLSHAVEKLAGLTMHDPVFVDAAKDNVEAAGGNLSDVNEDLVVPDSVVQTYIVTPSKLRMVTLSAYIAGKCQAHGNHKTLIFMATQDMVDYHTDIMSSVLNKPVDDEDEDSDPLVDVEFFKLHGNMSQKERTEVFKTFREAKSGVLLCTDVAARGLDLPRVDSVVQYTGPTSARDYVHRIGRTARAGSSGAATIFLTPSEVEFVRMLESRRIRIRQEDMDDVLANLLGPLSPHNSVHAAAIALQDEFEKLVLESKKMYAMACKAYSSWMRFYTSYPREMREVFNRKELHLGHYAKSFALRDPPQKIGGAGRAIREQEQARPKHQNRLANERNDGVPRRRPAGPDRKRPSLKNVRMLNTSEYDSGLEPLKKPKKS